MHHQDDILVLENEKGTLRRIINGSLVPDEKGTLRRIINGS
jgi:hypothetical protein